jgi:hypothetical protein
MAPKLSSARSSTRGFVLVTTLLLVVIFLVFIAAYSELSRVELVTTRSSRSSTEGFYAAEAGLNLRADVIRDIFNGYNQPSGTSPSSTDACEGTDMGTGDFACQTYTIGNRSAVTYIVEEPGNPISIKIPSGERYGGLSAQEYRYTTASAARNQRDDIEALLELTFRSRLVPMFQFAAFYDKDLEILPGPTMRLSGPVHTNGDLYLNAGSRLTIQGQVTTAGSLYRGRKNSTACDAGIVEVFDPLSARRLVATCPSRTLATSSHIAPFNGEIETDVEAVIVPEPELLDPVAGQEYWDKADLRVVMHLTNPGNLPNTSGHSSGIEVRRADNTVDPDRTSRIHACNNAGSELPSGKPVAYSFTGYPHANFPGFRNNREGAIVRMLEIDMRSLLNCAYSTFQAGTPLLNDNKNINDTSEGGLVFYFTVVGPNSSNAQSNYGVRIRNAQELQSNITGAPAVRGMTIVTNQALYSQGHFNSPASGDTNRIPAAFLADTYNPLSTAWVQSIATSLAANTSYRDYRSHQTLSNRAAANTNVNAAILSGTDTTGNTEGVGGQGGAYNGGLENYPRFHENWTGRTFRYRGSFVSLERPLHSTGSWIYGNPQYEAPTRDWDYDTRFNTASNLPPLSPRFVYLRQELFVRDFDR